MARDRGTDIRQHGEHLHGEATLGDDGAGNDGVGRSAAVRTAMDELAQTAAGSADTADTRDALAIAVDLVEGWARASLGRTADDTHIVLQRRVGRALRELARSEHPVDTSALGLVTDQLRLAGCCSS